MANGMTGVIYSKFDDSKSSDIRFKLFRWMTRKQTSRLFSRWLTVGYIWSLVGLLVHTDRWDLTKSVWTQYALELSVNFRGWMQGYSPKIKWGKRAYTSDRQLLWGQLLSKKFLPSRSGVPPRMDPTMLVLCSTSNPSNGGPGLRTFGVRTI